MEGTGDLRRWDRLVLGRITEFAVLSVGDGVSVVGDQMSIHNGVGGASHLECFQNIPDRWISKLVGREEALGSGGSRVRVVRAVTVVIRLIRKVPAKGSNREGEDHLKSALRWSARSVRRITTTQTRVGEQDARHSMGTFEVKFVPMIPSNLFFFQEGFKIIFIELVKFWEDSFLHFVRLVLRWRAK